MKKNKPSIKLSEVIHRKLRRKKVIAPALQGKAQKFWNNSTQSERQIILLKIGASAHLTRRDWIALSFWVRRRMKEAARTSQSWEALTGLSLAPKEAVSI
jgi:hypothetical protein